jgi:hypothetical protein
MQIVTEDGAKDYLDAFKCRGVTYNMILQGIENLNPVLVEQFKNEKLAESAVAEARKKLTQLEVEANFSRFLSTYGGN